MRARVKAIRCDTLGPVGEGRLGLTFCPGKYDQNAQTGSWGRDLDTDLHAVLDWGASTVVTLMETHELVLLRVPDLGDRLSGIGLNWWQRGVEPERGVLQRPPETSCEHCKLADGDLGPGSCDHARRCPAAER